MTPRITLDDCLALCQEALDAEGNDQKSVLTLLSSCLKVCSDTLAPSPNLARDAKTLARLNVPIIGLDLAGYVTSWSRGAQALYGYSAAEAIGRHLVFLSANDPGNGADGLFELPLEEQDCSFELHQRRKSGEACRVLATVSLVRDEEGDPTGLVMHLAESSTDLQAEERLLLYAKIIENSDQGILITDAQEHIVSVNAAFCRITGYSVDEALGQTPDLLRSGVHDADFRAQVHAALHGAGPWQGEIIGKRKNGELFPQSVSISVVRNPQSEVTHAFSIFSDITVLRSAEERMQRLAHFDPLTDLPNRTQIVHLVEHALAAARRNNEHGALLALDLTRFTAINDTLGYDVGDELLRQVAQRLRAALRQEDAIARTGGDEFIAALFSIQRREHSSIVAQKLLAALEAPFHIAGHTLHVSAAIGISIYPEDALDCAALLRYADVAMKRVQENGESGYRFYSPEMNRRASERLKMENDLRHALAHDGLRLYYQPKISLRNGRIIGAEALIRWPHPDRGMISPAQFIPIAEETRLILEIGEWVIDTACRQIRAWRDQGVMAPTIALNLSARQFDTGLPTRIDQTMQRHGILPDTLQLEITESLLVRGAENVIPIMNELVARGLSLALDDFGTGYSSLAYLKKFPITTLKIDRSFVIGIPAEPNDCAIAQAIVTMGQQLRQEIVAEGVETADQFNFLRQIGCDQMQGFLFSPALPESEFKALIEANQHFDLPEE